MKIILRMKILLHIISLHKSFRYSSFSLRSKRCDCFHRHKICYSSIHKDKVAINNIQKDVIIFIFIVETIEEDEK